MHLLCWNDVANPEAVAIHICMYLSPVTCALHSYDVRFTLLRTGEQVRRPAYRPVLGVTICDGKSFQAQDPLYIIRKLGTLSQQCSRFCFVREPSAIYFLLTTQTAVMGVSYIPPARCFPSRRGFGIPTARRAYNGNAPSYSRVFRDK